MHAFSFNECYSNLAQGRVLATSIILNLRSLRLNYHAVMNTLLFWDNRVPKRLVQMSNHLGPSVKPGLAIEYLAVLHSAIVKSQGSLS